MKKFAIIGVGGYVASKHLQAIKDTGNNLVVAHDLNDSVGLLDNHFRDCLFTTDYEEFESILKYCDFLVVTTPNYKHFEHILLGLLSGCDVICEKPLVLTSKELDRIKEVEIQTGHYCYTILQLRKQDNVMKLKREYAEFEGLVQIKLNYITTRGDWYLKSWKGDVSKSGGLETNIGIHLFDCLTWVFGKCIEVEILERNIKSTKGILHLEKAEVEFLLSIDYEDLSGEIKEKGGYAQRELIVDEKPINISEGFTSLHTELYKEILKGNGYKVEETRIPIVITELIRNQHILH